MTHSNDTVNPQTASEVVENGAINFYSRGGITKREYFAAMALQGLLASWGNHDVTDLEEIACDAAKAADHLINALNQQG